MLTMTITETAPKILSDLMGKKATLAIFDGSAVQVAGAFLTDAELAYVRTLSGPDAVRAWIRGGMQVPA